MKKKAIEYTLSCKKNDFNCINIKSPEDSYEFSKKFYFDDINIYESVFIILVNRRMNTIGYAKISQGGISGSVVDIRIICKYSIESLCSGVILVHNHPSGILRPSKQDEEVALNLKKALSMFDIKLIDSLIISDSDYYSFVDNGLI